MSIQEVPEKNLSPSMDQLYRLSHLRTAEKTPKRTKRKKDGAAELGAVIVGMLFGAALAVLQLQENTPRLSQVPESLSVITSVVAALLVTAALTRQVKAGLLCGAVAAVVQFLTVLGSYSYSYTFGVAIAVVPFQSLRVLTYPAAGIIGGFLASLMRETSSVEHRRRVRHTER